MNRTHTILVVALVLAVTTGIGWSMPNFGVSAALSEDDSLTYAWPYFRFTQLYEESFIECTFGEFSLHHTQQDPCWKTGTWGFFPIDWNEDQHSPLIDTNSCLERRNLTTPNMVHVGDTLSWLWSMGGGSLVGDTAFVIPDTVGFILAFHDSAAAITTPIDTIRITPISSVFDFWHHVHPLQPGTYEYRHRHVVTASHLNGDSARVSLRVIPTLFSGQESSCFFRWDIASAELLSELLPTMSKDLDRLIDSLVSVGRNTELIKEALVRDRGFRARYSMGDRVLTISFRDIEGAMPVDLELVSIAGRIAYHQSSIIPSAESHTASIQLPRLASGAYVVVVRSSRRNAREDLQIAKIVIQ